MEKQLSRSASIVARTMYEAMKMLKENGGSMPFSDIKEEIPKRIAFDEWERAYPSEKTHQPRWLVNFVFYSIDYSYANLIRKESGVWYLTDEGEKALKLNAEKVFSIAHTAYREFWKQNNQKEDIDEDVTEVKELDASMVLSEAEATAYDGIRRKIKALNPWDFQEICASLLRAIGYYTPFVAPKGKDGGIDIVAYENAIGTGCRIIAQVKHMPTTAIDVTVVRNLAALLKKDGDTGIVFSSGTFTNEAIRFAREQKGNIRLIGETELIRLWIDYYDCLSDADKAYLPLKAIYFVCR